MVTVLPSWVIYRILGWGLATIAFPVGAQLTSVDALVVALFGWTVLGSLLQFFVDVCFGLWEAYCQSKEVERRGHSRL